MLLPAWMPGPFELVIILVVALLIFGSRLPSAARSLGKSFTEFRKGLKDSGGEEKPPGGTLP